MRIRLLKPYGFSRPGDILDPDVPVAELLIGRGIAVAIRGDDPATIESESKRIDQPRQDKAMPPRSVKRKRRRR